MTCELRSEFDRCWPWLDVAIARYGRTYEKHHLWQRIVAKQAHFWPGPMCAIVTEFLIYPTGLNRLNFWLRGGDLKEVLTLSDEIEEWAKQQGCHEAIGTGRDGWLAYEPDYEKTSTRRRKILTYDPAVIERFDLEGQADQGRREGSEPRPLCYLPDGRGRQMFKRFCNSSQSYGRSHHQR